MMRGLPFFVDPAGKMQFTIGKIHLVDMDTKQFTFAETMITRHHQERFEPQADLGTFCG